MDGIVVVCGQPAGWKTMVQLAVWIGAAGAAAVAVSAAVLVGWILSDGEDDIVEEDEAIVAEDAVVSDDAAVVSDA